MTTLTARQHYAAAYYASVWGQDRQRAIFAGMTALEQKIFHRRAEYSAAVGEWKAAWDTPDEARWLRVMDSLNAELDDLEEQQRAERIAILEAA